MVDKDSLWINCRIARWLSLFLGSVPVNKSEGDAEETDRLRCADARQRTSYCTKHLVGAILSEIAMSDNGYAMLDMLDSR